jgi:hypothetical protein
MSQLQHDAITICNRSVALPRPTRPECNNHGFSAECLLSARASRRNAVSAQPAMSRHDTGPNAQMPVPPKGFGGHGVLCVFGGVLLFHPCG